MKDLPVLVPVLTEDEAKRYSDAWGPVITSRAEFKIDLTRGWKTFRLNQEAADFFITDFLQAVAGGEYSTTPPIPARYLKRTFVASAVSAHVDYLKAEFSKLTKKATPDDKDKWTKELLRRRAATRQRTVSVADLQSSFNQSNLEQTLEGRREIVSDPAFGLQRHAMLLNRLKPVHVSPDEPAVPSVGVECRTYHIKEALWQSRGYKTFMRGIDKIRIAKRAKDDTGGNAPCQRIELRVPTTVNSKAPKGLWRNCYDEDWLRGLRLHEYNGLEIIDDDYEFSLDPRPFPPPPTSSPHHPQQPTTSRPRC